MKTLKKIISLLLCAVTLMSVVGISASAATYEKGYSKYSTFSTPSNSGDYAYWNGSKVVKSSSTTKDEIRWMQAALNYCRSKEGLDSEKLDIDGSFGPACKKATIAFQKAVNNAISNKTLDGTKLDVDGSFGPATIKAMKKVLNDGIATFKARNNSSTNDSGDINWLWPSPARRTTSGFADNYYHGRGLGKSWTYWHRGIDIPCSIGTNVYASKSGTISYTGENSVRGKFMVIDHGDGYYSEYQHLSKIKISEGKKVSQGDVIALSGDTGSGGAHLHFEIMDLDKSGLGKKYFNYYSSYSKFVNVNPQNTDKIYCTKGSGFTIRQEQGNGIPTAKLVKTNNTAPYGVYCYDNNGINYIFK